MEASGSFSVVRRDEPVRGLTVLPSCDSELIARQRRHEDLAVCANCGARMERNVPCGCCGGRESATAVTARE